MAGGVCIPHQQRGEKDRGKKGRSGRVQPRCCRSCCTNSLDTRTTCNLGIICSLSPLGPRERERERERLGKAKFRSSTSEHLSGDVAIVPFQRLVHSEGEIEIAGDKDGSILLARLMITISSYYR